MNMIIHQVTCARSIALVLILTLSGCTTLVRGVTQGFAEGLATAILDNEDAVMVRDGAPSYLILIDSLIARSPDDAYMLKQSATLHSAYAAAFVTDEARAKLLHAKAKTQALQAACFALKSACGLDSMPFNDFDRWVGMRKKSDVPYMYTLGTAWAGWIQVNSDDFMALADLARVKVLMARVAELDPDHDNGGVYLYLGVFETLLPPALGGKPEVGRAHFEQAIARSNGQNLMAKVMFADGYARLVFDRELHDRLLREVATAPTRVPGLTLMNAVAKEQAADLLGTADDYF